MHRHSGPWTAQLETPPQRRTRVFLNAGGSELESWSPGAATILGAAYKLSVATAWLRLSSTAEKTPLAVSWTDDTVLDREIQIRV
jgi:hypothetical protein